MDRDGALRAGAATCRPSARASSARDLAPAEVRLSGGDLSTVETLVQELAHPDPARVVYAIDVLESLDKRNLVTPLLLYHESPAVRARALYALGAVRARRRRAVGAADPPDAVRPRRARPGRGHERAGGDQPGGCGLAGPAAARPMPTRASGRRRRSRWPAAAAPADVDAAESVLLELTADSGDANRKARRDVAIAIRHIADPRFRPAADPAALRSGARGGGRGDGERPRRGHGRLRLRAGADRAAAQPRAEGPRPRRARSATASRPWTRSRFFMRDADEDIWVRRHIPATIAQIPSQKSVDVLVAALEEKDGFLRYKMVSALERLRREQADADVPARTDRGADVSEGSRYFTYLSLHHNLFGKKALGTDSLLADALTQKMARTKDRIYRLLALIYPWKDIAAAEWTLQHGDPRSRASASEYLDNVLSGQLRKRIMPLLEDLPVDEKVRRGNVLIKSRPRDVEETLLQLINDDDQVVAAAAIDVVRQQQMWALADDIEHVLAHRDVRDWYVFEAASWALAEQRMPAERRRELWREPLPAAELAGRLRTPAALRLGHRRRAVPHRQRRAAGAPRAGQHAAEGRHRARQPAPAARRHGRGDHRRRRSAAPIEPPAALGFNEALQGQPMRETMRTERGRGHAGALGRGAADAAGRQHRSGDRPVRHALGTGCRASRAPVQPTSAGRGARARWPRAGCRRSRRSWRCSGCRSSAAPRSRRCSRSPRSTSTVTMTAGRGAVPGVGAAGAVDDPSGEVALTGPSAAGADPGALRRHHRLAADAERPAARPGRARSTEPGVALRIAREDLFDVLGERPELLRQMFAAMFRRVAGPGVRLGRLPAEGHAVGGDHGC